MPKTKARQQEFRLGLIKATVSIRRSKGKIQHSVSVRRLFRNGDCWKESSKFGVEDIPVLRLVLDRAYGWILLEKQAEASDA